MARSGRVWEEAELLDRLVGALESATRARLFGTDDEYEAAVAEGLAAIGPLYGVLDSLGSPEASSHLEAAYDECVSAFGGNAEVLLGATVRMRSIRELLEPSCASARQAA
jgi:hypothetical protein